jgi:hypothetical protein
MSEDPNKNTKNSDDAEIDAIFVMEEILDKLKLLDYESLFLKQK